MKLSVTLLLLGISLSSIAQVPDTVSLTEIFRRIVDKDPRNHTLLQDYNEAGEPNGEYSYFEFRDLVIVHDSTSTTVVSGDAVQQYSLGDYVRMLYERQGSTHEAGPIPIFGSVNFDNCVFRNFLTFFNYKFSHNLYFHNCIFERQLWIKSNVIPELKLEACTFTKDCKSIRLIENELGDVEFDRIRAETTTNIILTKNKLTGNTWFRYTTKKRNCNILLNGNEIRGQLMLYECDFTRISLDSCAFLPSRADTVTFEIDGVSSDVINNERFIILNNNEQISPRIWLRSNRFESDNGSEELIISSHLTDLYVLYNDINWLFDLLVSRAQGSVWFDENKFSSHVCVDGFVFSEVLNTMSWDQVSGYKLCVRDYNDGPGAGFKHDRLINLARIYKGSDTEVENITLFRHLIRSYKTLFDIFKKNGDIESANGCYAEMKQVETRRWKHEFKKSGSFEMFFRWQLNRFLSYFTDYGTNPAKAVIKSIWVVLIFAIFYLFFPSDWDISNRSQLLRKTRELISKNREKSFLATLGFVLYSGFVHILNALTLSLNAFTTLGFGDIPTHGAARYVTIVQGFIGWFLLTIFSVSLINQVLG